MSSSRNNPPRDTERILLDAARECVEQVGLRRTTLTDVSRRAGLSRMTVYRRWPDMTSLVADLMTREWTALIQVAFEKADGADARGSFVAAVARVVRDLRQHPVFRRIVELDPEVLLPYLVDRRGTSQDRMLALTARLLDHAHGDGSIRRADPNLLARSVLLAAYGFVLSAHTMTDTVSLDALDEEFTRMLDAYLAP
jgi:AcrR family transcriptional regulator